MRQGKKLIQCQTNPYAQKRQMICTKIGEMNNIGSLNREGFEQYLLTATAEAG